MFFMFGDEADADQGRGQKFFVYGAVFVPANNMPALHTRMEKARKEAGLGNTDSLKSASNSRPKAMTFEAHRDLKKTVMSLAREVGDVTFCAQVTLHELARNKSHDDLVLWGANTVLSKFNQFLEERNSHGYAVLDKIPVKQPYQYLKEKFQVGLKFPVSPSIRLDRVLGFAHAVDGSSHMCSVADVMLGAFRYCVNEPENKEAGKAMFPVLMSMMWKRERAFELICEVLSARGGHSGEDLKRIHRIGALFDIDGPLPASESLPIATDFQSNAQARAS
jgi:hypothetical protein